MNLRVLDDPIKIQTMMEDGFYSRMKREPRLLFGGYPTNTQFERLKQMGVRYFIDLTTLHDRKRLSVYQHGHKDIIYINFPIRDNFIPYDMDLFNEFIVWLVFTMGVMKPDEQMYVHCKGGHGRSGMVVCCILCLLFDLSPEKSIEETTDSHNERPLLTPKWRTQLCPSNEIQRMFIHRIYQRNRMKYIVHNHNNIGIELEHVFNTTRKRILDNKLLS